MTGTVGWILHVLAHGNQSARAAVLLIHHATMVFITPTSTRTAEGIMLNARDLIPVLLLTSAGLFGTTVTFAVLWVRARERAIRAFLEPSRQSESSAIDIQHLVHAVDSIAVEVERISEGQRFTTQVLTDRVQGSPSSPKRVSLPERVITPH